MRVNHNNANHILLDGCPVEIMESFGCTITTDSGADEDVDCRRSVVEFANFQVHKLQIFNACVKSVLLYRCETWLVSNSIVQRLQRLETFVNKCLRIICSLFWPNTICNIALLKLTEKEPIMRQIKRRNWRWKPPDSISRLALLWNPQRSRGRGRP